ncbi:MAG: polymer-forming cytoskeletal protein [Anaerolineae bacterium]|nr:polymer-forming cytoskeletal protein [Anaerolineae bacterium]
MKMRGRNFLVFAGAVVGILILALLVRQPFLQRATPDEKNVIFESYTLTERHAGDLAIFGGTVALDVGSRVGGSASLLGDTIAVAGAVEGDLGAIGDTLIVNPGAQIAGNANLLGTAVTFGGTVAGDLHISAEQVTILPGARISGVVDVCAENLTDQRVDVPAPTCINNGINPFAALIALRETSLGGSTLGARLDTLATMGIAIVGMVMLTGFSVLLVTFFPRQISHIEEAMRARPRGFGGVGIAVYALAVGVFFGMILLLATIPPVGLLLIPVFLILVLALVVLTMTGLVTAVIMIGDWLLSRVSKFPTPPLIAAVAGSLALSVGLAAVALLPFGFAISVLLLGLFSSVGLGASLFTRIGTRPVGRTYFIQG